MVQGVRFSSRVGVRMCGVAVVMLSGQAVIGGVDGWLTDPAFERFGTEASRWEVRYGQKASEPTSRPRWLPRRWTDAGGTTCLDVRQTGAAAGTLYIGQRFRAPAGVADAALSVRYQTCCPLPERSGLLRFDIFSVSAWDALGRTAEAPGEAVVGDIYSASFKGSGEDVLEWTPAVHTSPALLQALAEHAGTDVVGAVAWTTWHPAEKEWCRLTALQLGPAPATIRALSWPRYAYPREDLVLDVAVSGPSPRRVFLDVVSPPRRRELAMTARSPGQYRAVIPGAAVVAPLRVRAVLTAAGEQVETEMREIAMTERPRHPCLFYTPAQLARMREKVGMFDWAQAVHDSLRERADAWLAEPVSPPTQGGGWSHDYTCPSCGGRLRVRRDHPHDHLCPRCERAWQGEKLDKVWRGSEHSRMIHGACDLALMYQLSSDVRYGRKAVEILRWYADRYMDFPVNTGPAGRGRVHAQSLTECTWLLRVMDAADLAYAAMTPAEARHIETDLVRAGAEHTHNYTFGIHNIQCWHNSCYAAAGYFLGDPEMIGAARDGRLGFVNQVDRGILEDGLWYERSLGYHNYTLGAIIAHCTVARNNGDDLHRLGRVPLMFTAPLRLAFPDLSTPSLNDMGYSRRPIGTRALELAVSWYGDVAAAAALAKLLEMGANRRNLTAWTYGEVLPEASEYTPPPSEDLPGAGLAVLRRGTGQAALCAMLEYGEHGGGHGHPDKLQLILYGLGQPLCPDIGTTGYGNPMHSRWYKTTPGHNTVTVGGASMGKVTGELLAFAAGPKAVAAAACTDAAYTGWKLTRKLLLTDVALVDLFEVEGPGAETLDWFLRAPGALIPGVTTTALEEEPLSAPYRYLDGLEAGAVDASWEVVWQVAEDGGDRLHLTVAGCPGTQVATAVAPGPAGSRWPLLRIRRQARATRFLVVYQFLRGTDVPAAVRFTDEGIAVGDVRFRLPEGREACMEVAD